MILKNFLGKEVRYFLGTGTDFEPCEAVTSLYTRMTREVEFSVKHSVETESFVYGVRILFLQNGLLYIQGNGRLDRFEFYKNCFPMEEDVIVLGEEAIQIERQNYVGFVMELFRKDPEGKKLGLKEIVNVYLDLESEEEVQKFITRTEFTVSKEDF